MMSLSERLQPGNTLAAKSTAQNAFARFLQGEGMSIEDVHRAIKEAPDGRGLGVIMDKFAIYLAFGEGTRGARLATNTVNSYFGNVKLWLLSLYPHERQAAESELQVVGARISKYCKKRSGGQIVKQASACRKQSLQLLLRCVYKTASTSSDYVDGLLLSWLWYLFGRSSDLNGVEVSNVSVYPGGALSIRFRRQKTAADCGLTLFRDKSSFETCPVHALALALAMKSDKSSKLFNQLPHEVEEGDDDANLLSIPLRDLLNEEAANRGLGLKTMLRAKPMSRVAGVASPAIHSYVNRLIGKIQKSLPQDLPREELSSHSFRRGGAQHANGTARLSPQWILDRGSWNMSATNKGFVYVMNTTQEDQRVSRCLSGWDSEEALVHIDLADFDGAVIIKIRKLMSVLFSGCAELDSQLSDVLMASILRHYPAMVKLYGDERKGFVGRLRECLDFCGILLPEFLAWHSYLAAAIQRKIPETVTGKTTHTAVPVSTTIPLSPGRGVVNASLGGMTNHNLEAIVEKLLESNRHLCESNRHLSEQVQQLRDLVDTRGLSSVDGGLVGQADEPSRARKAAKKRLRDVWVEWRSHLPPRWAPASPFSRQEKHEYKVAVAYMSIFLVDGYVLDPSDQDFAVAVQRYGELAEANLLRFLRAGNISASSLGTIVKAMRELYTHGELNPFIEAHAKAVQEGRVRDHLPRAMQAEHVLPLPRQAVTVASLSVVGNGDWMMPHLGG